jgi:predicted GNAT family acetyltransferase
VSKEFTHEPDARRYVLRVDGELVAVVDYAILGTSISFTHTYTAPHLRGHGYAAEVVEFAVNDVEAAGGLRIVPMCWYVGEWFEKHPERAGLLSR